MVDQESQVRALSGIAEGDVMEAGTPFLFAPKERLTWRCVGIEPGPQPGLTRYLFHVYFMGVVVKAACGELDSEAGKVTWGAA